MIVGLVCLQMFLGGWLWMVVDGFGCWQIVLGGFKWFSMTYTFNDLATVKFVALNLKEVNNNGEFF